MHTARSASTTIIASCFGVCVRVEFPAEHARAVAAELPYGWVPAAASEAEHCFALENDPAGDNNFRVRRRRRYVARLMPLAAALAVLQKEILLTVAEYSETHVFIHAGVVGWKDRLILFPGRSYSGKSTLVWKLIEAGGLYYSDEYAVLDRRGQVHPFPLPVSLRSTGTKLTVPEDRIALTPVPPDVVAFAKYRPGVSWAPSSLTPAQAMLSLMRHCVGVRRQTENTLLVLKRVALQTQGFMGKRGDALQILDWLNHDLVPQIYWRG
jgi:hypothetical protein